MRPALHSILLAGRGDPEASAIINRMGALNTPPSDVRARLIRNLIWQLKNDQIWHKLDALWILAAHSANAAYINWKNPQRFTITVGVTGGTFTADRGYAGNGSDSYLDTNFSLGTAGNGGAGQNNAHMGVWSRTDQNDGDVEFGNTRNFLQLRTSGNFTSRNMASGSQGVAVADSLGHFVTSRDNSATYNRYKNAVDLGDATQTSGSVVNVNMLIGAWNNGGTPSGFSTREVALAHAGVHVTARDVGCLYRAFLNGWMTPVGAA